MTTISKRICCHVMCTYRWLNNKLIFFTHTHTHAQSFAMWIHFSIWFSSFICCHRHRHRHHCHSVHRCFFLCISFYFCRPTFKTFVSLDETAFGIIYVPHIEQNGPPYIVDIIKFSLRFTNYGLCKAINQWTFVRWNRADHIGRALW